MVYGVVVVHDTNDYSKMTMKVWRNRNATYKGVKDNDRCRDCKGC